jgi:hypothetical protein
METEPEISLPTPPDCGGPPTPAQRLRVRLAYSAGACIVLLVFGSGIQNIYITLFALFGMLVLFVAYLVVLIFGCARFSMLELLGFTIALGTGASLAQNKPTAKWGAVVIAGIILGAFVIVLNRVIQKEGGIDQG